MMMLDSVSSVSPLDNNDQQFIHSAGQSPFGKFPIQLTLIIYLGTPGSVMNQYYSMSMPAQIPMHDFAHVNPQAQSMATSFGSYNSQHLNSSQSLENNADGLEGRQRYISYAFPYSLLLYSVEVINEKRRKRRESHNAVERRRRDHINEKIAELSSLLPEYAQDVHGR